MDESSDFLVHGWIIRRKAGRVAAVIGIQVVNQYAASRRANVERTQHLEKRLHRLLSVLLCERLQLLMEDPEPRVIRVAGSAYAQEVRVGVAIQKRRRVYPAKVQLPTRDIRRVEQLLSEKQ